MPAKILLAYTRRSVMEADRNTHSPERQRANMEQWAADHGYQIEHFQDLGVSGRSEARPGWQALLNRLDDPDVAGVITESLDRLHRNAARSSDFRERLEKSGKEIIFTNMPGVDANSAHGRMILNIHAVVDQYWTDVTSEKMRASVYLVRVIKRRHWGKRPFGTDRDPVTLHLIPSSRFYYYNPTTDETKASPASAIGEPPKPTAGFETRYYYDALTALFQLYATAQYSYGDVAQALNLAGWRIWAKDCNTPRPFTFKDIEIVTRQAETYAGQTNRTAAGPLPAGHEPILPVELCEAVVSARQVRSTVRSPGNKGRPTYTYLLSGILTCATCGSGMGGQKANAGLYYRHTYYKNGCPEKSPKVWPLESQVIELLMGIVKQDLLGEVEAELRAILELASAAGGEAESAATKLLDKEAELDRLIRLHVKGRITFEQFDSLEKELQAEIAELKRQTAIAPGIAADIDRLAGEVAARIERLPEANREQQKILIRSLVEKIQVSDQAISSIKPTSWARPFFEFCGHFTLGRLVVQ